MLRLRLLLVRDEGGGDEGGGDDGDGDAEEEKRRAANLCG